MKHTLKLLAATVLGAGLTLALWADVAVANMKSIHPVH